MILVKHVEFVRVETDRAVIHGLHDYTVIPTQCNGVDELMPVSAVRELIRGREFRRPDGESIVVGCSKQAESVFGIQYEAWDEISRLLSCSRSEVLTLQRKIGGFRRWGTWKRLKWLLRATNP